MDLCHQDFKSEIPQMFGDLNNKIDSEVTLFDDSWDLPRVAILLGLFPSRSQAIKNGWGGSIPTGWTDRKVGKNKTRLCIWNPVSKAGDYPDPPEDSMRHS